MSWYYDAQNDKVFEATGAQSNLLDGEIKLEETGAAVGVPQLFFGPFATQQEAQQTQAQHKTLLDQVKANNPLNAASDAVKGIVDTAVKLVTRILEAAAGIVLLAIAANAILHQTTGVDVAGGVKKVTKTAAKAAVL